MAREVAVTWLEGLKTEMRIGLTGWWPTSRWTRAATSGPDPRRSGAGGPRRLNGPHGSAVCRAQAVAARPHRSSAQPAATGGENRDHHPRADARRRPRPIPSRTPPVKSPPAALSTERSQPVSKSQTTDSEELGEVRRGRSPRRVVHKGRWRKARLARREGSSRKAAPEVHARGVLSVR